MKKLVLGITFAAAGLVSTANAQIQKGNTLVGASLLTSNFGLNTDAGYDISLQPRAAYFIEDNIALGGYVTLGTSKITKDSGTKFTYAVGGLGRYYVSPGEQGIDNLLKHGRFFMEGNVGVGGQNTKGGTNTTGLDFGFGPGYSYFITPNIGIEGLLKYNGITGFGNEGLTSNLSINVGFSIYLPSKVPANVKSEM
ncbi:hypothetical protein [Halpernia frigidisoli]|uniref:Outer membrane protein beta-barrel domain-containing protein n=1 Tax=Halpernia frigidisoli TaxID=1125876 RepID=A0A1I3FQM1_9FLAO|nr:hypothetical protein [Halpernia frigidisoli]SFI13464.1 hypothetical protein SAMN05443292_1550 [Halpernia frigidisoli]